ncbi:OmpA family protein [Aestuariivita boseongensis]|uniref:OmpA family protein n=1 Tax=Aestuariivita boseongensis TaxID=1470562 RepID=UPI00068113E8|nr:OmpA family protein [Aestuariivita boseongensis]
MLRSALVTAIFILSFFSSAAVEAFECRYCEGKDPGQLIELSVSRESPALRAQIRRYVAETYPETGAGYAARAWIADGSGAPLDEVERLYKEAIKRDPSVGLAYTNLGYVLERQDRYAEAFENYVQGARAWPQHAFFVQYAYFNLKNGQKNPDGARAYLERAEREGTSESWVYDYTRGIDARGSDRRLADQYFQSALNQGGRYDAFQQWIDNRLRLLAAQRASRQDRFDVIRQGISWAYDNQSDAALRHIGKILWDDFNLRSDAFDMFASAYDMNPSPEAAHDAFGVIGNDDFARGLSVLERGLRDFPNNYYVLIGLTWAYTNFDLDPQRAEEFGLRAIAAAPTAAQLDDAVNQFNSFVKEAALYDRAIPIYERYLTETSGAPYNSLLGGYIDNRIHARDFATANRLMERVYKAGGFSETWIAVRENRIANALRLANQRERYYAENPFLKTWEERFGDSLRVTVEFATGKADIRPEGYGVLDRAAQALKAQGAEKYVFLIEGHTDSTGSDAINIPLSQARASAVESYFVQNAGITPERIQTVGYGPRIPLATNQTDSGKQTNRRVEIRPYGNIAAPRIVTTGWLDARSLDLTSDGRFAITGNTPAQVWDVEKMVRVHQLPIGGSSREISPNGRYVAVKSGFLNTTGSTDHNMFIYDMRTGLTHSQLPNSESIDEISWSPFSDEVAYTDRNGFLRVYTLATREMRVAKMGTIRGSEAMAWSGTGEHIVTKVPRTSTAVVFDAKTLRPVLNLRDAGWVHSMVSTQDGAYMVAMNNSYELIAWRTSDWQEVMRQRMPAMTFNLVAHPTENMVMINDAFTNNTRLALVEVPSGRVVATASGGDPNVVMQGDFTPDGSHYVATLDDEIVYYKTDTLQIDRRKQGQALKGQGLTMVEGSDMVVSLDSEGTSVWSLKTGRQVHRIKGAMEFAWAPLNSDGTVLFSFDESGAMHRFDTQTFRSEIVGRVEGEPYSMSENDTHLVVGTIPHGDGPFSSPQAGIYVIEKSSLRTIMQTQFDIVSEPVNFSEIYDPRVYVRISDSGLVAVTSSWMSGFKQGLTDGRIVTIYDPQTNRELTNFQAEDRFFQMKWEGEELWFRGKGRWYVHDPNTGRSTRRETPLPHYEVALDDGRNIAWFLDHVALDGREVTFPYNLRSLKAHEGRNIAVGQTTGNELIFIDLNQMKQALTIAPRADGEWIAFTPDGRYTASLGGTSGVYWSLGDNYLPFSALAEQYERPGLIRNLLEAIARGEAAPDTGPDVEADVFEAPYTVRLLSPERSNTKDETFVLELEVDKDNADLADPEIEYTLNGRRVLKSRGFEEEAVFDGNETVGLTRRFDLNPGVNVIEASLVWRDARLQTQRIEVIRDGVPEPERTASGQTLWFFGVGVSDYERSSQNLNFAHRDAQELARLMEEQQGRLFDRVETRILTNADATERNVRIQMNEFLDQSGPDDVIVLFLAGHGVVDEEQELYFMTHEGDLTKPYTGMGVDRFRDYLENRPLNQNALLLLDICHSGAADGRVVAEDAVQQLTKGTGAVVFASSSGSELSFEDESFGGGHGAFTAALLEGLRGMADSRVGNRDGFNSLQEMVLFTSSRVPELTEGQQRPQIPPLALNVDYPLSRATN